MKPFTNICSADKNNPWTQDATDKRFFFVELTRPWTDRDTYYERNPQSGKFQSLTFDSTLLTKKVRGESVEEDTVGVSFDRRRLWRFSSDSQTTLRIEDMAYEETEPINGYKTASGQLYTDSQGRILVSGAT